MNNTFLITGSDGHLGNTIVNILLSKGYKVRGLRFTQSKLPTPIKEECYYGDVSDISTLDKFFNAINPIVIHTAGIVSVKSTMDEAIKNVNIKGTYNVVKQCIKHNAKLIYISSVHAISQSQSLIKEPLKIDVAKAIGPYAKSKAIATNFVRSMKDKIPINIVYPSGMLGPGDYGNNHLNQVIKEVYKNKIKVFVKGGYDIVDIRDVANAVVTLAEKQIKNEEYLLTGKYISVRNLICLTSKLLNKKAPTISIPHFMLKIVCPLSTLYYKIQKKPVIFSSYALDTLNEKASFSNDKAKKDLNFTNRPIENTIKDILEFYDLK